MNIGVNCFGMKRPFYDDFDGALERLKASGVTSLEATVLFPSDPEAMPDFPKDGNFDEKYVEKALWPLEQAAEKIKYVREKGLSVISIHIMSFMKDPGKLIEFIPIIKKLSVECNVPYFVFSPMKSAEELLKYAPVLNQVCEEIKEVGAKLLIHNHEQECVMVGDKTGLELVLEQCPNLGVELDVGWAKFAGSDAVALMEAIKDNLDLVHFKDIRADASPETRDSCFTAVGEGSIPLAAIMEKVKELGIGDDKLIIDQDDSPDDMLDDIETGVKNILACI